MVKKMKFKVTSFKRMDDPHERKNKLTYMCYVHISDIPEDIPMSTNPREQNLKTNVARDIEGSLLSDDKEFHNKNRGLTLSVGKANYNNKTGELTLLFEDLYEHGDIDGGHTYKILLKHKNSEVDQYVKFEIMVGSEDIIEELAAARNTSSQVDTKSLAELAEKFGPIKDSIGGMPFYGRVAFKQNQHKGTGVRIIDAREIVAILEMFNISNYNYEKHPVVSYSSKARVLDSYLEDQNEFEKMHNIAPDIFDLYNLIEKDLPEAYSSSGGRYGAKKFSGYKDGKKVDTVKFGEDKLIYKVPQGIVYPILGAFRSLIEIDENTNMYRWKKDPFEVYKENNGTIAQKIIKYIESTGNNPNSTGKDSNAWDIMYMTIERSLR